MFYELQKTQKSNVPKMKRIGLFILCSITARAQREQQKNKVALQSVWDVTMKGMSQFTDFLRKTEPQNLEKSIEVLRAQIRLTACFHNLQERIKLTELKQREIHQTQEALKKYEREMEENEKTLQKTPQDVKEMYEQDKADSKKTSSLLEDLKRKMEELQRETDQFLEESFNHIIKLEQNALKVNAVSTHVHLDLLIEKMKEKGDTEKVQKLEEIKRRMDEDEGTRSVWRYMSGKLTAAGEAEKEKK